jgi:hypothetical protein
MMKFEIAELETDDSGQKKVPYPCPNLGDSDNNRFVIAELTGVQRNAKNARH